MGQWYEQPDEDAPYFGEPKSRYLWKRALWFAVMYAAIAGAVLLVAMLAGCKYSGPYRASLEIRYANGKLITSGHAGEGNPRAHGSDLRSAGNEERTHGASAQNSNGDKR